MDANMRITLWTLMHDPEILKQTNLDPLDFPEGATRYLVQNIKETWERSHSTLTPALMSVIVGDEPDLVMWGTTLDEVVDLYDSLYDRFDENEDDIKAKRLVASKWLRTLRLNRRLDEAADAAERGDLDGAEQALNTAHRDTQPQRGEIILDIEGQALDVPRDRPSIPTGVRMMDKWFRGGIHLGQMGVVLAPPNTGKSMFLPYFAANAMEDGKNVIYYSTELPDYEIYKRTLSALTDTPIHRVRPEDALDQIRARRKADDKPMGIMSVRFRDTGTLTTVDIAADIEEMRAQGKPPHVIMLDGDDIGIAGKPKDEKLYGMYFYIYGQLASLVAHENVAVWTAAQATREALEKGYVKESHVADSMWKLRRSDIMLGVGAGKKFRTEEGQHFMRLYVLKDRYYGKKGRSFPVIPKWGFKDAPGTVGFDEQWDIDAGDDPFAAGEE